MADRSFTREMMTQVRRDFNDFVRYAQTELSRSGTTKTVSISPVYSGFFASSWKVDRNRVSASEERTEPWKAIAWASWKTGMHPANPVVIQRFPMNVKLRVNTTYYIGNTARHARWALASPKSRIPQFIQGELREHVTQYFKEKKLRFISRAKAKGFDQGEEGFDVDYGDIETYSPEGSFL